LTRKGKEKENRIQRRTFFGGSNVDPDIAKLYVALQEQQFTITEPAEMIDISVEPMHHITSNKPVRGKIVKMFAESNMDTCWAPVMRKYLVDGVKVESSMIAIGGAYLDLCPRPISYDASGNASPEYTEEYSFVYLPSELIDPISQAVKRDTGMIIGEEGIIHDRTQGLMRFTGQYDTEGAIPITIYRDEVHEEVDDDGDPVLDEDRNPVTDTHMVAERGQTANSLYNTIKGKGEDVIIGGVAFGKFGISAQVPKNNKGLPPEGTKVRLKFKLAGFHLMYKATGVSHIEWNRNRSKAGI
jgi:hypothetical protein